MAKQAFAAVARTPGGRWDIEDIMLEDPRPGEILVRIAGVGLCHTDLAFGGSLQIMKAPAVLGHEGSGIVERVGEGVSKVRPGDHVVLTFNSCGECPRCDEGRPAYCVRFAQMNYGGCRVDGSRTLCVGEEPASANFFGQSSFASYALANERNTVRVDPALPIELLGPLGCGVQTGVGAVMNSLACPKGSSLLVIGAGAVGLSAVLGAKVQECATILVVEPREERRALALELGATHAIDPASADFATAIREIVPVGVDYAFDTTGRREVIESAMTALAPRATFGLVGIASPADDRLGLSINQLVGAGHIVMGIIEGDSLPDMFIPRMIELYKAGELPFDRLVRRYPLSQINEAIADQHAGRCVKAVMIP